MKLPRTRADSKPASAKASKDARPPRQRREPAPGRLSLESAAVVLFVTAALLLAALALFIQGRYGARAEDAVQGQAATVAEGYAGQVEALLAQYRTGMTHIAHREAGAPPPQVQDALHGPQGLASLFPGALRVHLLPAGTDSPDGAMSPPLSYACLDLVQRAVRDGQDPPAELHRAGTPEQHIDLVQALRTPRGQVTGSLLVSLPPELVQQRLNRLRINGGYVEVRQGAAGDVLRVAARGNKPPTAIPPAHSVAIAGTAWELAYWPGPVRGAAWGAEYWVAFGVVLVLLGLVALLLQRLIGAALLQDQISILRTVKDMRDEAPPRRAPARLRNSRAVLEQLHGLARQGPQRPLGATPAAAADPIVSPIGRSEAPAPVPEPGAAAPVSISAAIFRAYDIRGVVGADLGAEVVRAIGQAIGSEAHVRDQQKVIVARDGRLSGPELSAALIDGLVASGREVIDIGRVPTPVLYFATHYLGSGAGVMLTGSHNPSEYNGLKIMLGGQSLYGEDIQALRERIETGQLISGAGTRQAIDVSSSYLDRIIGDVRLARPMKVVVDCGNGVAGELAPALLRALGCEVVELYCEVDGTFPNHHPDPGKPENLIALTRAVTDQGADLGVAFDGDGDRLGVVDSEGKIIWPDRLLMLLAQDVLLRHPGALIIYDVKCTRHLERLVREHGGEPVMAPTGHSLIKAKMAETGALLAGEMSGHIFYKERWFGFDDALYSAARLLEILSSEPRSSAAVFDELPESVSTPELNVATAEGAQFEFMERLMASARFGGARLITIDGLRVEFEDGWGLVRASNTTPCLVLRFEADDPEALRRIQDEFRQQLLDLDPGLDLPF